jgi:hypothetical protein
MLHAYGLHICNKKKKKTQNTKKKTPVNSLQHLAFVDEITTKHSFFLSCNIYRFIHVDPNKIVSYARKITYFDAELCSNIGVYSKGTKLAFVVIDCVDKNITLHHYDSQKLPDIVTHLLSAIQMSITPCMLVNEIFLLLERGHSLNESMCYCDPPTISKCRRYDIGIYKNSKAICSIHKNYNRGFTDAEIGNEIGVSCIYKATVDCKTVVDLMHNSGMFIKRDRLWFLSNLTKVNNITSLLTTIQKKVFGIDLNDAKLQYQYLERDVHILTRQSKIIILTNTYNKNPRLFALQTDQQKCDPDVSAMWHNIK